ncbi:MAG: UDP-3-O-acyl-N-acetylglucosamine deacetylase [Acaryochloridaceae cyanobacterium RU_4_10]|nr:UDP-3-O-acyl-N-acetylglucosamine deacetylase [Acaryochloridaceae cyanobacterium RU_4_10]
MEDAPFSYSVSDPTAQIVSVLQSPFQHTLNTCIEQSGIGLHTGETVDVRIHPAPVNTGRYFVRTDLEGSPAIVPARIESLHQTVLSTELTCGGTTVRTVEHLLAALAGLGVDNARIEINGPETPLLDGSAQEWVEAIVRAGWEAQSTERSKFELEHPAIVQQGDAFVMAVPAEQIQFTYGIDFPHPAIGQQWQSINLEEFAMEIAPARTFGFAESVEKLRASGLIKGGSLDNALVCGTQGWINPPLRYPNEPARHKLLDLVGDLSLLGIFPKAHIVAYKGSHSLHTQLVRRLAHPTAQ